MIYYIFAGQIFNIFLSMSHLTVVSFNDKITDFAGLQQGEVKIYSLDKHKSLVFESKKSNFNGNFIVFLKNKKYYINFISAEKIGDKSVEIKEAKKCSALKLIKETAEYKLFECPRSILFINKLQIPVKINDLVVSLRKWLSKGPSIILNGKTIYSNGVAL